ncbi:AsmA-like C-terminal domain-containing protein [Rhizobiales bacterium]|uniref:AsmA-like C-terminal domain-containing protein n=1 Tax=Hongsoonwoonella zoysiae TaxID=2821844 RepID=UPI00155FA4CA|nr:AsmA-like C-terminal domain-containing protein [Hongsoonwoonella zoysiae]
MVSGPVDVPRLARLVEDRIAENGLPAAVTSASIDFTLSNEASITIENMTVGSQDEQGFSVTVPRVVIPVELSALLEGRVRISSLTLERLHLIFRPKPAGKDIPKMADVIERIDKASQAIMDAFAKRGLESIQVVNGDVTIRADGDRYISGIDARLSRGEKDSLILEADIAGRFGRWEIEFRRMIDPESGERIVSASSSPLTLGEFMARERDLEPGKGLGVPFQPRFEGRLTQDGTFKNARFNIEVAGGWIKTGRSVVAFDRINVGFAWAPGLDGFRIQPSHYVRGRTVIPFQGLVESPRDWGDAWSYKIISRNARILPGDVSGRPLPVSTLLVQGRADPEQRTIFFDRAAIRAATAKIDGAGSVQLTDEGPYLALALESEGMPVATLKRLWPVTFAPPARDWVIDHLLSGNIEHGRANVSVGPGAFDRSSPDPGWSGNDVGAEIKFNGVGLTSIGTVPALQDVDGALVIADEALTIDGTNGRFDPGGGETVAVPRVKFSIPNFRQQIGKVGRLEIAGEGASAALGAILDSNPFNALEKQGISPQDLSGDGTLNLEAEFPLVKKQSFKDVDWKLTGNLKGFSIAKPVKGRRIEKADLSFSVDGSSFAVNGRGRLDGLAADIDIFEPLGEITQGDTESLARQGIVLDVSAEDLKKRGIDLGSMVSGDMTVSLDNSAQGQLYEIDLTNAKVAISELGWQKSSGVPGSAKFELVKSDAGQELRDFQLTSEGVDIKGAVYLAPSGELKQARFSEFKLRPSDSASLKITRTGRDALRAELTAQQFDGRGLIAAIRSNSTDSGKNSGEGGSISVNADIALLLGFNGVSARDVKLDLERSGDDLQDLSLKGLTGGKNAFEVDYSPDGEGGMLSGTLANTGEVLRFLDFYKRMRGGRGRLSVDMDANDNWVGSLVVKDLSITEDPAIKELSTIRPVAGDDGALVRNLGAVRQGEASFQRMSVSFRRSGDTITVTDGTMTGATVGGTFSGTVNLGSKTLDLTGTFVPAFALNNLFAKIPVLGFALGGGSDEGLIGVTYRVTGALADPQLSVNPVSAIAPGIFRKLFEYR